MPDALTDLYPFLRLLKSWSRASLVGFVVIRPGTRALVSTGHFPPESPRNSSASSRFATALPLRSRSCASCVQSVAWMLKNGGGTEVLQFPPRAAARALLTAHSELLQSDLKIHGQRRDAGARSSAQEAERRRDGAPRRQDRNVRANNGGVPLSLRFTLPPDTKRISIGGVAHYVGCTSLCHAVHSCRGREGIWGSALLLLLSRAPRFGKTLRCF